MLVSRARSGTLRFIQIGISFALGVVAIVAGVLVAAAAPRGSFTPRFFFAGGGRLVLRHAYFDTTLDVRYRRTDGTYDAAVLGQINHFFRSREDGREAPVSLRLIELLAYIRDHYHPQQMILLSGYRSPQFNAGLAAGGGAALASLHTEAMAADVMFRGLDMARLWHQLRALRTGGAGYYRKEKFLHIDTGPPRFWEETTSRVGENLSAGNARIFARTDFDRYAPTDDAIASLHSVTAFPLAIAAEATLVGDNRTVRVTLAPNSSGIESRDGCFAIQAPADRYQFRIARPDGTTGTARGRLVFKTCEPRIERTPEQIESNEIELAAR